MMIFINPQWQGSGLTDELKHGAETFEAYFKDFHTTVIPLSDKGLQTIDNIQCFEPLLEQSKFFKKIIAETKPDKVLTIGGDCGIEIIPISYLNTIYEKDLAIVWIDAHADLNTPESSPSKAFHGMPLRVLLGEGNQQFKDLIFSTIEPQQICFSGLRDVDPPEAEYIVSHDIATFEDCSYSSIYEKIRSFNHVYIHLDLDVLDQSEFRHTMFPTFNGFWVKDVALLIENIKAHHHVVGFCITESTATQPDQLDSIQPILDQFRL